MKDTLSKIEQNFNALINEWRKGLNSDIYSDGVDFVFPKITAELLNQTEFIAIPGMLGGFSYKLIKRGDDFVLYVEQSSRMDYSSDDYLYYEITADGRRQLQGKERDTARAIFEVRQKVAKEQK